ncbi:MAG: TIGR03769 domain-containing protein, partial [Limisphaerales bacterium]
VEGPGHFILYQADLGGLNLRMDSRDGIDDRDRTDLIVGSHEHLNWAFTTNGIYRLTFQAAGRRVGESTNIVGADTTLVFHVLPLPPELPDLDPTPAQLAVRRMANGDLELDLTGTPGARYAVEIGSDLNQWSPFQTVQLTGGTASLALPNTGTARFFRATAR